MAGYKRSSEGIPTVIADKFNVVLPFPPSANRYWRSDRGGRPHVSNEARAYKTAVGYMMNQIGGQPREGAVAVRLDFYRPAKRGDLDNLIKVTLDALIGYAYADDEQVTEIHAVRRDDKNNPRVEVEIVRL